MDAIFTLPFSEYAVANELNDKLKKDGYSIYIPASRQQKGVDLIINKNNTSKAIKIQVKASRSYYHEKDKYKHNLWFGNFEGKYKKSDVDFFILFGLYPKLKEENGEKVDSKEGWEYVFLCFNSREMSDFLNRVKTKKEGKRDSFLGFGFNSDDEIFFTRGNREQTKENYREFLLKNRIEQIKEFSEKQ